jgi:hypothetical protein
VHGIREAAYWLTLSADLQGIPDVFHVLQLSRYLADPDHVVNDEYIELTPDLNYVERLIRIIGRKVNELRRKTIPW